jgi:hypothetical protein
LFTVIFSFTELWGAVAANIGFLHLSRALDSVEHSNQQRTQQSLMNAINWLDMSVRISSGQRSAFYGLALAFESRGDTEKATKAWRAAGFDSSALLSEAKQFRRQHLWESAWTWFSRAKRLGLSSGFESVDMVLEDQWTGVSNSSFETDTGFDFGVGDRVAGNGIPDSWAVFAYQGDTNSEWVHFDLVPGTDNLERFMQVKPQKLHMDLVISSNPFVIDPGTCFSIIGSAMRSGDGIRIRPEVVFRYPAGQNLGFLVGQELGAVDRWEILSISGRVPEQTGCLKCHELMI